MPFFKADLTHICCKRVNVSIEPDQLEQPGVSDPQFGARIADIVWRSLVAGRIHGIQLHDAHPQRLEVDKLERYIDKVIGIYTQEHARVERLAESDDEEWGRLQDWLTRRAVSMLRQWEAGIARPQDEAADFAQQACESIFRARFPFDVPFEAWAALILKNHIRQRYTRSRDLIDRRSVDTLDGWNGRGVDHEDGRYDSVSDSAANSEFEYLDVREELLNAIAQLPSLAQQRVIIDSAFYERSDAELAERLGRTKQAVYNLRLRALRHLKEILLKMRSQDKEPDVH
jgi:RNA polymerase sigma factor (sigma-70 family)